MQNTTGSITRKAFLTAAAGLGFGKTAISAAPAPGDSRIVEVAKLIDASMEPDRELRCALLAFLVVTLYSCNPPAVPKWVREHPEWRNLEESARRASV